MRFDEKFPLLSGENDPRIRRELTPVRLLGTWGSVRGAEHLCEKKIDQIAIHPHTDGCWLTNAAEGERAAVLVDFGMEIHGTLCLSTWSLKDAPGGTVSLRVRLGESAGEALTPVGERGTTNDHATRDLVLPIGPHASTQTGESGFRFAYVELLTPGASLELRTVTATLVIRDLPYRGSFESSDPLLGKIYDTAAYTVHLNMQRYLWDGIKRDRLVWAGDLNTEIATILAVFGGGCDVVRRSLDHLRDTTPPTRFMNGYTGFSSYSLWWVVCHYDWFMGTGDMEYLRAQIPYLKELLPRFYDFIGEDGAEKLPPRRFFDWPNDSCEETRHAGLQGLMRHALRAGSEIFRYAGETAYAEECARHADRLLSHRPDPRGEKQVAAMLAIGGIRDVGEMYETVIAPGGARGLSTFLGYFTLMAAAQAGRVDGALDLIRGYWGRMLEMGATTFWEDFDVAWAENAFPIDSLPVAGKADIHGDFGAYCYKNFRHSLCHGWASGPAPFLSKYVLGIRPFAPGCRAVRFAPDLGGLRWARGTYPTPYGEIAVELERGADGRTLGKIDTPDGVEVITK